MDQNDRHGAQDSASRALYVADKKASSPWGLASVRVKSMQCGLDSVGAEFRGAALKTDRCLGMELTSESAAHGDQGRGSRGDPRVRMGSRLWPDFVSQGVEGGTRVASRKSPGSWTYRSRCRRCGYQEIFPDLSVNDG